MCRTAWSSGATASGAAVIPRIKKPSDMTPGLTEQSERKSLAECHPAPSDTFNSDVLHRLGDRLPVGRIGSGRNAGCGVQFAPRVTSPGGLRNPRAHLEERRLMANHRSPKPGLQVRLLPLLFFCRQAAGGEGSRDFFDRRRRDGQERRPSTGAAGGRPGANEVSGGRRLLRPRPGTPAVLLGFAKQNQAAGVADGSAGARECHGPLLPRSVRSGGRNVMPSAAGDN